MIVNLICEWFCPLARDAGSSQARGVQRPLFLTGMMGCGKTTVGRILADEYDVPLVDLDARIERLFGRTVAALFEDGEAGFRGCERQALRSLVAEPGVAGRGLVVATGGGAILDLSSCGVMDAVGTRVYLEVGVDELSRRLRADEAATPGVRPLIDDGSAVRRRVAELLAARRSRYRSAGLCVDGQGDPQQVAVRVMVALGTQAPTRDSEAV